MFKKLSEVLKTCDLSFTMKMKDNKITVMVNPINSSLKDLSPLVITGTAEELDQEFDKLILAPMEKTSVAINQVKDYEAKLEASKKKKTDKSTPAKTATVPTAKKEEPKKATISLFADVEPKEEEPIIEDPEVDDPGDNDPEEDTPPDDELPM